MKKQFSTASWKITAAVALSLIAGASFAADTAKAGSTGTNGSSNKRISALNSAEQELRGDHHQAKKLTAAERKPRNASNINARLKYGSQNDQKAQFLNRPSSSSQKLSQATQKNGLMAAAPVAACDTQTFASASGSSLVNAVKTSTSDCINTLFSVTGTTAGQIFNEAKMVTIADGFRTSATSYNGTNSDGTLQLIMFLRAGYYVNWSESASTGVYGTALKNAVRPALDAFAANGNFGLVNDVHGETLSEFVTLIDSSSENARFLTPVVKRLLSNYNSSYDAYWWMKSAVNNVFTVLFRGHQNADFVTLIKSDTSIVDSLYNFINSNFSLLGGAQSYMVSNAGREMGRFLQYAENTSIKTIAKSRVKLMLDRSNITGTTAGLWVGLGEMVEYYDKVNCSYYNLCDFVTRLEATILPVRHSCSSTLRIRAQSLTAAQLAETCQIQLGQEAYFHQQAATGKIPVANDNNTQLEMNVFTSSDDYGTYAGAIFGIDTNNGGMYLEGDPAVVGNQPRFIAYQAEWMLPKFEIWNLTHEYVHYLDGRFNLYGDFGAAMGVSSVWWIEGFAEFMSYSYRNLAYDGAKTQAAAGTYNLSTIFKNDYNSGQTRVYNWGYLAVRYMFEKQRNKVTSLLGYFRPGNWTGYTSYMNGSSMSTSMDTDFKNWLPCVNTPSLPQCGGSGNVAPVANFTSSVSGLSVNFTNASSDSDGTVASYAWNFGDGTTSTAANPSKTYSAAGSYTVSLVVKDNAGASSVAKTATVTVGSTGNVAPVANFTSSVSGLSVNFTNASTDSDGSVVSYAWNFGDGTTSTAANPSKTYAASGSYTVSLVVKDNAGASSVAKTATVTVSSGGGNVAPVANFTSSASGLVVNFTNASTDSDGTVASYAWNFGDGTTSTAANPSKTYAAAGSYTVSLVVKDNAGASSVAKTATVTVTGGTSLPECPGAANQLGKNCVRSNVSAPLGDYAYMYVYVPAGVQQMRITTSGGTGNADLYVSTLGTWATRDYYNYGSYGSTNTESVTVYNPPAGYVYVSLYGQKAATGVKVTVQY